jgi:hypothetical protein
MGRAGGRGAALFAGGTPLGVGRGGFAAPPGTPTLGFEGNGWQPVGAGAGAVAAC